VASSKHPVRDPDKFYHSFPHLNDANHNPTSDATPEIDRPQKPYYIYNCFAFIVGDKKKFWWPDGHYSYWPRQGAPNTAAELMAVLSEDYGYEECEEGEHGHFEKGVQKVAIFVKDGVPVHVAIQPTSRNGEWCSKMGYNIDMEHDLRAIETHPEDDPDKQGYGVVTKFMKLVKRRASSKSSTSS